MSINRRVFLRQTAAAGAAAAVPAAAVAATVSPRERLASVMEELKAVLSEIDPTICEWDIIEPTDRDTQTCGFMVVGRRQTTDRMRAARAAARGRTI